MYNLDIYRFKRSLERGNVLHLSVILFTGGGGGGGVVFQHAMGRGVCIPTCNGGVHLLATPSRQTPTTGQIPLP